MVSLKRAPLETVTMRRCDVIFRAHEMCVLSVIFCCRGLQILRGSEKQNAVSIVSLVAANIFLVESVPVYAV